MRHLWIISMATSLFLWGCPAEPSADDDDDDDAGDDDAGDDDTQGDDDTAGDDDAGDDDMGGDDDTGDDDDTTPNPDAPVISNFQIWVEYVPKYEVDALVLSVDYTDPQGDLTGGESQFHWVDAAGGGFSTMGPHNLPDGPSGTYVETGIPIGEEFDMPPGFTVTVSIAISDGEEFWSNELSEPYTLP
jgi:hypothetical protein